MRWLRAKDQSPEAKKKRRRRRFWFYGGLVGALWGFWVYQPWEYDFIPRRLPEPNPSVSPDPGKLFGKGTKILLVTAHPDDSEFYIGGTLTQLARSGAEITQVICTDGDKAYYPFEDWKTNQRIRKAEQQTASSRWKVKELIFLGFPDGRLRANEDLVHRIRMVMEDVKPDYVLGFDGDYPPRLSHQDHRRAGDATQQAFWAYGQTPWLLRFSTSASNYGVDITDDWATKQELIAIHKSQFSGERLQRVINLVASYAEAEGEKIGVPLGEGFRCSKAK